jgi:hypothetical protein
MDVFSVVTYIGLICDPVGGVGFLPAPVPDLPLVRCLKCLTSQDHRITDETYISDHGGHIHTSTLMMMTEMDIETSVYNVHLTRLIAQEDFIKLKVHYCVHKSLPFPYPELHASGPHFPTQLP